MEKLEAVESNGSAFAPNQCLKQKIAVGMQNPRMHSPTRCNKRTLRYRGAHNPVSSTAYRAKNGDLGKFEGVINNGTAFPPKQCFNQKAAVGVENPKMHSHSRCNKRTGRYSVANNPVSCTEYIAENGNFGKFEAVEINSTAFAPNQCLYQKVAVGV